MPVHYRVCIYLVTGTGELALYFTVYSCSVDDRSRVHGSDRDYKRGNLALGLIDDLGIEQDFLRVHYDSMSAIYLAKNQVYHTRTNHIDVKYHFVWDVLKNGDIEVKIHTKDNLPDMLTKVVLGVKFNHCKNLFRILPVA